MKLLCSLLLVAALSAATASAAVGTTQIGARAQSGMRLDLGSDMAKPGGAQVSVPLVLEVAEGIQPGRTVNEIAFAQKLLSFEEARKGVAAELVGAEIKTEIRPHEQNPEISILKVMVTSTEKPIRTGVLASLMFRLSKDAPTGQPIRLGNVPTAFTFGSDSQPIDAVTGREGVVEVMGDSPVELFACFFYMH